MKSLMLVAISFASISSFALVAPKGEYIYLACNSVATRDLVNLQVVKNTESTEIKLVIQSSAGTDTYQDARQELGPQVGGAQTFRASTQRGFVHLKFNRTTSPHHPNGTLSVVEFNKTVRTPMRCSQVAY